MAAKLDLVGEVFGKLTVKSFSGQRRTRGVSQLGLGCVSASVVQS